MKSYTKSKDELEWSEFIKKYPSLSSHPKFDEHFSKSMNERSFGFYTQFNDEEKNLTLKRFIIRTNPTLFFRYLTLLCNFQTVEKLSYKTNYVIKILNFSQNPLNKEIYVVQSMKKNPLYDQKEYLSELEIIYIIRNIVSLYSHLLCEYELVKLMLYFHINPLNIKSIWHYRKFWEEIDKKLARFKIKLDLLAFDFCDDDDDLSIEEIGSTKNELLKKMHLTNLLNLINGFHIKNNWGLSFRCFLNRLKNCKELDWSLILSNPLFIQSKKDKPNWKYWKINSFDKIFGEENEFQTIKSHSKKKPIINELPFDLEKESNKTEKIKPKKKKEENQDEKKKKKIDPHEEKINLFIEVKNLYKSQLKEKKIEKVLYEAILNYMQSKLDHVDMNVLKEIKIDVKYPNEKEQKYIENMILKSGFITKEKLAILEKKNKY